MSLDVSLYLPVKVSHNKKAYDQTVWVREDGRTKKISRDEYIKRFGREPFIVKPDPEDLNQTCVFEYNITHNLGHMARQVSTQFYQALWHPELLKATKAGQLVKPIELGLTELINRREYFLQFNPPNGWGNYEGLVKFASEYLLACKQYRNATIHTST